METRYALVTLEALVEVEGGEPEHKGLRTAASVFAHHLRDANVWQAFALCPDGEATPTKLAVSSVVETDSAGAPLADDDEGTDFVERHRETHRGS